ncbi:MAG: DNA mismatch repair endonuclease MutL [Bacteriovoracaceae bacterium]
MQTGENTTSSIQELPELVINQIKAGEVIERPSQMIKEIIENALDSGADRIEIEIRDNGLEFFQVKDNGKGMGFQDLPLAFKRHATSKIQKFDDIYHLSSFGFRGEALASISGVSSVKCQSVPKESQLPSGEIVVESGKVISHQEFSKDHAQTQGTTISVRELFATTPVRFQFLKSKGSEKNAITKILNSFLLAWPDVEFFIKWDSEEKTHYPKQTTETQTPSLERVAKIFSPKKNIKDDIIHLKSEIEELSIELFFTKSPVRGSQKKQYFFVNQRMFFDKNLHFFLVQNLSKIWQEGPSGHYVLFISCPSDQVDVNVHPSKVQVKFLDESHLFSTCSKAIKTYLSSKKFEALETESSEASQIDHFLSSNQRKEDLQSIEPQFKPQSFERPYHQQDSNFSSLKLKAPLFAVFDKEKQNSYLVNSEVLFLSYLEKSLTVNPETVPLIIGEPFSVKYAKIIDNDLLKSYGFHFDIVEDEYWVLRQIPKQLTSINLKELIPFVLAYLGKVAPFKHLDLSEKEFYEVLESLEIEKSDAFLPLSLDLFS